MTPERPTTWPEWPNFERNEYDAINVRCNAYFTGGPMRAKLADGRIVQLPHDSAQIVLAELLTVDLVPLERDPTAGTGSEGSPFHGHEPTDDQLLRIDMAICNVDRVISWSMAVYDYEKADANLRAEWEKRIDQEDMMKRRQLSSNQIRQLCQVYAAEQEFLTAISASREAFPKPRLTKSFVISDDDEYSVESTVYDIDGREDAALAAIETETNQVVRDLEWSRKAGDTDAETKAKNRLSKLETERCRIIADHELQRQKLKDSDGIL
ncbi:uncharacterized protein AB675_8533 [Cyphellophora attinorum]|uniref:Uncharacterized protein n=1 Tax=Cyphellophora attinorum TaxID=1664694 RepID=A0A0N0NRF8_9EURO|nr:uncharacterized protein AB675_8533 [Phialophora attinorum]KPI44789.1 hypothetical protein AB675_8533 [Phialophora attinorum]